VARLWPTPLRVRSAIGFTHSPWIDLAPVSRCMSSAPTMLDNSDHAAGAPPMTYTQGPYSHGHAVAARQSHHTNTARLLRGFPAVTAPCLANIAATNGATNTDRFARSHANAPATPTGRPARCRRSGLI
jgi:hypothetical protein